MCMTGIPKETTKLGMKVGTGREQQTKINLLCNTAVAKTQRLPVCTDWANTMKSAAKPTSGGTRAQIAAPSPCLLLFCKHHQHKHFTVFITHTLSLRCTHTSSASHSWCLHWVWRVLKGQFSLKRLCTTFLVEMSSKGDEAIPNLKQYSQKIHIEDRMSNMECNQSWWKHLQLCNLNYWGIFAGK